MCRTARLWIRVPDGSAAGGIPAWTKEELFCIITGNLPILKILPQPVQKPGTGKGGSTSGPGRARGRKERRSMKHYGVFDIIGPIMVGPSSSHTAGAARLGLFARHLCGEDVKKAVFYMHGSFAETYAGHGTDKALLAGIQGVRYDDERLKQAYALADKNGIEVSFIPADLGEVHPNTVRMELETKSGRSFTMTGSSIGGGSVCITQIDGVAVQFSGERPILATRHMDEPGVIAGITAILYAYRINIGNMQVNRSADSHTACMYMELDGELPGELKGALERVYGVQRALLLDPADMN